MNFKTSQLNAHGHPIANAKKDFNKAMDMLSNMPKFLGIFLTKKI